MSGAGEGGLEVKEVSRDTFAREVVEASHERLVVVDFWAGWCAPCRALAPVLERAIASTEGRATLAKVDVESEQELGAAFEVRSIPAVKAFRDGRVVAGFEGARGEEFVASWLAALLPSASEEAIATAAAQVDDEAIASLTSHLAKAPGDASARLALARRLADADRLDEARSALDELAQRGGWDDAVAREGAFVAMLDAAASRRDRSVGESEEAFAAAGAAYRAGDRAGSVDRLLAIVRSDRAFRDDGAHHALLALLARLEGDEELVSRARRDLGMILFS